MAWTAPRTWTTSEIVTASLMNTHLRDNMNETAPAKAFGAGGFIMSNGANSVVQRTSVNGIISTSQSTTSTSYTNLATNGPELTTTTGTSVLVILTALIFNATNGADSYYSFAISGASTVSATDANSLVVQSDAANSEMQASFVMPAAGLTAGSNTFTAKYRASAGTANFQFRRMTLIPLN